MSAEQKPGDPADKGLDTFQPTTNHRAGYGDDKLARLVAWLRAQPTTTLASGEGALLLAEIDRLRNVLKTETETVQHLISERTADREHWGAIEDSLDRAERILAALREPSEKVVNAVHKTRVRVSCNCLFVHVAPVSVAVLVRAAVATAEQEVGRE